MDEFSGRYEGFHATDICSWHHEKQVYEDLINRSIEAFLPIYKVRRRWSDRYKIVEEPLFKNYLFVNVDYDRRYYDTLRPYGAVAFVMFDGKPAQIPEHEIESVRTLVESETRGSGACS